MRDLINFVGRPIRGYLAAECILSVSAANALETVQRMLTEKKLSLIVWDCYRPKRAVDDFLAWSRDPALAEMKAEFYPRTGKATLFAFGYLANRSAVFPASAMRRSYSELDHPVRLLAPPVVQRSRKELGSL